jgi:argininosuccinate lyase
MAKYIRMYTSVGSFATPRLEINFSQISRRYANSPVGNGAAGGIPFQLCSLRAHRLFAMSSRRENKFCSQLDLRSFYLAAYLVKFAAFQSHLSKCEGKG